MTSPTDLEQLAELAAPEWDAEFRAGWLHFDRDQFYVKDSAVARYVVAVPPPTILHLLADRRELVAGLKLAVEIANRFYGSMFCYDTDTADIAKLQAIAASMGET